MKLGFVEYKNSLPLYFGLKEKIYNINICIDSPSTISKALIRGNLDMGQISLFEFLCHKSKFDLLNDFCISAKKDRIQSVILFSKNTIESNDKEIIYLTNESSTSIQLLKIILNQKYKINPIWHKTKIDFIEAVANSSSFLLIGDEALKALNFLKQNNLNYYFYDLAQEWFSWQGLPFVFAVFVKQKGLVDVNLCTDILECLQLNLNDNLQASSQMNQFLDLDMKRYLMNFSYQLNEERIRSIKAFEELALKS